MDIDRQVMHAIIGVGWLCSCASRVATPTPSRSSGGRWRSKKKCSGLIIRPSRTSLDDLATLYANQDRYGDAEALYRRALAIQAAC